MCFDLSIPSLRPSSIRPLPPFIPAYLPTYLPTYMSACLPACLRVPSLPTPKSASHSLPPSLFSLARPLRSPVPSSTILHHSHVPIPASTLLLRSPPALVQYHHSARVAYRIAHERSCVLSATLRSVCLSTIPCFCLSLSQSPSSIYCLPLLVLLPCNCLSLFPFFLLFFCFFLCDLFVIFFPPSLFVVIVFFFPPL